ncbi:rhomboid family intramembrane serine protease [bacterium]|nr:MAG: rhomboid family intramembrane serine protease [bacterium]
MALPLRSKNPPESFPFATIFLIIANVFVYIVTTQDGFQIRESVVQSWAIKSSDFSLLKMFSAMFLHGSLMHLLGNMWFLALFGFAVEGRLRWYRYVPLYLLAGLGGDVLHHLIQGVTEMNRPSLGASGAIMGIVGAALWMFPYGKVTTLWGWSIFTIRVTDWPMWGVSLYYLGFDLLEFFLFGGKDGVGHLAHLGGALAGFLVCIAFRPKRDSEMASDSKATLAEVKDLGILGRMELAELHRVNPDDPLIVLHWMDKSLRESQGPNQACVDAFFKHLPKMRREMDPRVLAAPIMGLSHKGLVKAREMVSLAGDLERTSDNVNAMRLYEVAYGLPDATDDVQETSCFRTGLLCENVLHNADRAASCYHEVLHRWPMGSFAQQAKVRLTALQSRTKV